MAEMVSPKLIDKILKSGFNERVKEFLIEAIREEFAHGDQARWNYVDFYKNIVEKYSKQ